uniref:Cation_ATPase_C domain-containing protein n=1 Tax=Rhabditophanes sp. KR3021 TaxID=114890 RepID=A0AC35U3M8_9BILA
MNLVREDGEDLLRKIHEKYYLIEHEMNFEGLSNMYALSRLNIENISMSRGLTTEEAMCKKKVNGSNIIIEENDCLKNKFYWGLLYIYELLHTFRVLMLSSAAICLLIFFLDPTRHMELSMAIFLTLVLNVMVVASLVQKQKIINQVKNFQKLVYNQCELIRDGGRCTTGATNVVPGDLIYIKNGDRIVADLRLLKTNNLRVESSWLTGQTHSFECAEGVEKRGCDVLKARNIAYKGSYVSQGCALGLVIRTGNDTVIGQLIKETKYAGSKRTGLEREYSTFVWAVTFISFAVGLVTFITGLILNDLSTPKHVMNVFINGFLVVVLSNIPQGLTVIVTTQMIIIARRLEKQQMFIKKLEMADTLGTTTVLLCDKNTIMDTSHQKVISVYCNTQTYTASDLQTTKKDSQSNGVKSNLKLCSSMTTLLQIMTICNRAVFEYDSFSKSAFQLDKSCLDVDYETRKQFKNTKYEYENAVFHRDLIPQHIRGKPTDISIIKFVRSIMSANQIETMRSKFPIVYEEPFDVNNRKHFVIVKNVERGVIYEDDEIRLKDNNGETAKKRSHRQKVPQYEYIMMVKGAAEEIYRKCSTVLAGDKDVELNLEIEVAFEEAFVEFASKRLSCIGFANKKFIAPADIDFAEVRRYGNLHPGLNCLDDKWCFVGMTGIETLIRANVKSAVEKLKAAGISLLITSGDHPESLKAAGNHIMNGLSTKINYRKLQSELALGEFEGRSLRDTEVIHSDVLGEMTDELWRRLLHSHGLIIFSRARPRHRLEIVRACQRLGEIVTVTGHGVLDSPALKEANIGLAVNAVGSSLAQEAADVIAKSTSLPTIMDGIIEGKMLYLNIKKSISYTLSHMLPEIIPIMLSFTLGYPLILNSIQVMVIDLFSELPPSIALIFQKELAFDVKRPKTKNCVGQVPWKLLSYCYIQIGSIITLACLLSYHLTYAHYGVTPSKISSLNISQDSEALRIIQEASGAWHITLVISQAFHVLNCSTYRASIIRKSTFNGYLIFSVFFEIVTTLVFLYVPFLNNWLQIKPPPYFVWIVAVCSEEPYTLIESRGGPADALTSDLIPCQSGNGVITFVYWIVGQTNFEICLVRQNNEKFNCTGVLSSVPKMPAKLALGIPPIDHPFSLSIIPNGKPGLIVIDDIVYSSPGCAQTNMEVPRKAPVSHVTPATTQSPENAKLPWTMATELETTTLKPVTIEQPKKQPLPNLVHKKFSLTSVTLPEDNLTTSALGKVTALQGVYNFSLKQHNSKYLLGSSTDDSEQEFDLLIIGSKTSPLFDKRRGTIVNDTSDLLCDFGFDFPCLWGSEAGRWATIEAGAIPSFEEHLKKDGPSYPAALVIQGTSMFSSDPLPCQTGSGKLLMRYWSNGKVKIQVCALGFEDDSEMTICMEPSSQEGVKTDSNLALFEFEEDILEPFTLNIIPEFSKNSKNEFFILDEIAYVGSCNKKSVALKPTTTTTIKPVTVKTTRAVSTTTSTTTPISTTIIPVVITEHNTHYCDLLNCNFNDDAGNYLNHGLTKVPWTLRSKGYGFPLTRQTDIRSYAGQHGFISTLLGPGDFAILESPLLELNQINVIYFQYYRPSYAATIRMCTIDKDTKPFRKIESFTQCPPILKTLTPRNAYNWQNKDIELPPGTIKFYLIAHNADDSVEKTSIAIDNIKVAVCEGKQSQYYSDMRSIS